jgi:hypothetical protein
LSFSEASSIASRSPSSYSTECLQKEWRDVRGLCNVHHLSHSRSRHCTGRASRYPATFRICRQQRARQSSGSPAGGCAVGGDVADVEGAVVGPPHADAPADHRLPPRHRLACTDSSHTCQRQSRPRCRVQTAVSSRQCVGCAGSSSPGATQRSNTLLAAPVG